jgi:hypothetical protein
MKRRFGARGSVMLFLDRLGFVFGQRDTVKFEAVIDEL